MTRVMEMGGDMNPGEDAVLGVGSDAGGYGGAHRIDRFACRSELLLWNPGFKLAFAVTVAFACICADRLPVSAYVFATMSALNLWKNRLRPVEYARLMGIPLAFILMGGAALVLEAGHGDGGWRLTVTGSGLLLGLRVTARSAAAVSALFLLLLSTPASEVVAALRRLRVPSAVTSLMSLTYRYIFLLTDTQYRMRVSAKARLGYEGFRTSLNTFGGSLGSLLALSLRRAEADYRAMEARCFEGELRFLEEERPVRAKQVAFAVCYMAALSVVWACAGRVGP